MVIAISKKWSLGLLIAYSFLIVADTILIRSSYVGQHFQPQIFWSYRRPDLRMEIVGNILMFIPVGVFGGVLWRWKCVILAAGLSFAIELTQLISCRGLFEFDDIIHNTLGAVIGVGVVMIARWVWNKIHDI